MFAGVMARPIIELLFTEQYTDSTEVFQLYLLVTVLQAPMFSAVLLACSDTRAFFIAAVVGLSANVGLNLALAPLDTFLSPAVAVLGAQGIVTVFLLQRTQVALGVKPLKLLDLKIIGKVVSSAITASVVISPFYLNSPPTVLGLLVGGLIFGGVYLVTGTMLGLITNEEWYLAFRWMKGAPLGELSRSLSAMMANPKNS
jgi:O-antigen/teichoic acid export membrane protein